MCVSLSFTSSRLWLDATRFASLEGERGCPVRYAARAADALLGFLARFDGVLRLQLRLYLGHVEIRVGEFADVGLALPDRLGDGFAFGLEAYPGTGAS
jgi:hypothetical protein